MFTRIIDKLYEIMFPVSGVGDGLTTEDRRYLDGASDLVDLERRQREIEFKRYDNGRRFYL